MFRCQKCKKVTKVGEKLHRVVVDLREVNYFDPTNPDRAVGQGWEIVREEARCGSCVPRDEAAASN